MPKYEVDDRVLVRKDLQEDTPYYMEDKSASDVVVDTMFDLMGKPVTIIGFDGIEYIVDEDTGGYGWTDEMFEGYAEEE